MKKFLFAGLCLMMIVSCAGAPRGEAYTVKAGRVEIREVNGVSVHSFIMPDASMSHIIETDKSLMVFDLVGSEELAVEYSNYIESLGKPVSRVYLSHNHDHHLIPVPALKGVPAYTLDTVYDSFFELDAAVYAMPDNRVSAGTDTVDGVTMTYTLNYDGTILYIKFPELNMVWTQHLMYSNFHLPLPGAPVEKMISDYRGYDLYLASHGLPGGSETDEAFIAYQKVVTEAVQGNDDPAGAVDAIKAAYPDWMGAFLLDIMIPGAYKK